MQSAAYMAEIRALVKNSDLSAKSKKSAKKKDRPSILLAARDTPAKRPTIHSPTTRQHLAVIAEQRVKLQNEIDAEEAAVLAVSVSNHFFLYCALS
jgi:hypothetical protein